MTNLNKVQIIGRLGADVEGHYTSSGKPVSTMRVATNGYWINKDGEKQERVEWHRVVVWNKLAELCNKYLSKGRLIYVEGRLQSRKWKDRNNIERYVTEIIAADIVFLDRELPKTEKKLERKEEVEEDINWHFLDSNSTVFDILNNR